VRAPESNLRIASQFGGRAEAVTVVPPYAYLCRGASVVVVDPSRPDEPRQVTVLPLPSRCEQILASGTHVFVPAGLLVHMIDVSRPAAPRPVAAFIGSGHLAISGTTLLSASSRTVTTLDVHDPERTIGGTAWSLPAGGATITDIVTGGGMAYVATTAGLYVLDVRDAKRIVSHGKIAFDSARLAIDRDSLFVLAGGALQYLSAVPAGLPNMVSELPLCNSAVDRGLALALAGPRLLAVCGDLADRPTQIQLLERGPDGRPQRRHGIDLGGTLRRASGLSLHGLALTEGRAYLALRTHLEVLDVADAEDTESLGRLETAFEVAQIVVDGALGLVVEQGSFFAATGTRLLALDLQSAEQPRLRAALALPVYAFDVALDPSTRTAFVGGVPEGAQGGLLSLVDVRDPDRLAELGRMAVPLAPRALATGAGYLAWVDGSTRFHLADTSAPSAPREIGHLDAPDTELWDVAIDGRFAYVRMGGNGPNGQDRGPSGLWIVDLSIPAQPTAVTILPTPFNLDAMAFAAGRVYLGGSDGMMLTVDVSDPAHPRVLAGGRWTTSGGILAASGPLVAVLGMCESQLDLALPGLSPPVVWRAGPCTTLFDASSPSWPQPLGRLDSGPAAVLAADTLYLPDGNHGLAIARWAP
jgi:hypothetical protein